MKKAPLICIIYLFIILASCARKCVVVEGHYKLNLNNQNLIGKCSNILSNDTLSNYISEKFGRKYKVMYCPVLMLDNKIGIYQFWELKTPLKTDNFFLFDRNNITYFNDFNDSINNYLAKNSVSKSKIKKLKSKIATCKKYNSNTSGNF